MAKMIPPFATESTSSNAERKLFKLFQSDSTTADWVVLHSLSLSKDKSLRPYGEIDFVLLIPTFGIVCVEVKGGGLRTADGVWFTRGAGNIETQLKRSPFQQARESMFMLRERILGISKDEGKKLTFHSCYVVIFPDCQGPPVTPEFTASEFIDSTELKTGIGNAIRRCIKERQADYGGPKPIEEDLHRIRRMLRPDFDRSILFTAHLDEAEEQIAKFTSEQINRLEDLEENHRCLFDGPAGTGKTILAMNFAKRLAADGNSTLFVCFNRLLGKWLALQGENTQLLKVSSIWSFLSSLVERSELAHEFFEKSHKLAEPARLALLSEYARLAIMEFELKYDALVVDEAQDLARSPFLPILDDLVAEGLKNGRWAIFGDFSQQVIYGQDACIDNIRQYSSDFTHLKLKTNCRNTRQVVSAALRISDLSPNLYRGICPDGPDIEIVYYDTVTAQVRVIEGVIERMISRNMPLSDIILLSPSRLENTCLNGIEKLHGFPIIDLTDSKSPLFSKDHLNFCTVAAFKGLENKAAIIFDVQRVLSEQTEPLLYIALTRPRTYLILIAHERSRSMLDKKNYRQLVGA